MLLLIAFGIRQLEPYLRSDTRVSFLAVGQGDAILVEFPKGKAILIDTGPSLDHYSAADRIIAPYLRQRGISQLEAIFVTHSDADHASGLGHLVKQFDVKRVYWNGHNKARLGFLAQVKASGIGQILSAPARFDFNGVSLDILHPISTNTSPSSWTRNNASLVIRLTHGQTRFLFAGDIEGPAEQALVARYSSQELEADVLKLGHHGSKTSSTRDFLKSVQAKHAVISVGKGNRFKMPHTPVLERLNRLGIKTWRTDEEGLVVFETDGNQLSSWSYRPR
jgi:competence protein ComEC